MVKILALQANPSGTARLRVEEEIRLIEDSFSSNGLDVDIKSVGAIKLHDLQTLLLRHSPEIVHFSGHSNEYGELYFEDIQGGIAPMHADILESVFKQFSTTIKFVVLNACYSEWQATVISKHIPYVIGMARPIRDYAATVFSSMLYRAMALGKSIEDAFSMAVNELKMVPNGISAEPVLIRELAVQRKIDVSFAPRIYANFIIENGRPYLSKGLYNFRVFVKNYSKLVTKVVYQFDEDELDFEEQFDEQTNRRDGFASDELNVYGDILIRATLWNTEGRGIGISCNLVDALRLYYEEHPAQFTRPVNEAFKEIEEN